MLAVDGKLVLSPSEWFAGTLRKELTVFNREEYSLIMRALVLMQKSCNRLAAKEEQPIAVAEEYRKASAEINTLFGKVQAEHTKLFVPVKPK